MASNQRFTEKAQEAILSAQRMTQDRRLSQLETEALLEATAELDRAPRLQYSAEATVGSNLRKALQKAEDEARQFGDEYVSTEHLLLGILDVANSAAARLLGRLGVTRDKVYSALGQIRGNQRITSANPESTYEALEKYGRDLTAFARDGKLDPVIGRDE